MSESSFDKMHELLIAKQVAVKQRWLDLILESYPENARGFFKNQRDRFQNPVGSAAARMVEKLFDALVNRAVAQELAVILDEFIRIRAVQEFAPSVGLSFILDLKRAVRETVMDDIRTEALFSELLQLESRIDETLLTAFNLYVQSREKMYEIKANNLKRQTFLALKMMGADFYPRESSDDLANPELE